jgi:hypothetical protein
VIVEDDHEVGGFRQNLDGPVEQLKRRHPDQVRIGRQTVSRDNLKNFKDLKVEWETARVLFWDQVLSTAGEQNN